MQLTPELMTELRRRLKLIADEQSSEPVSRRVELLDRWLLASILLGATVALFLTR